MNIIIGSLFGIISMYLIYQLIRNNKVAKIRRKWVLSDDSRYNKYDYDYMYKPSKHNLYGLRFPRDVQYV